MIDHDTKVDALNHGSERLREMMREVGENAARYGLSPEDERRLVCDVTMHLGRTMCAAAEDAAARPAAGEKRFRKTNL